MKHQRERHLSHFVYSREVNASPAMVWDVISDRGSPTSWLPIGRTEVWPTGTSRLRGVGAVRERRLGGHALVERIVEQEPMTSVTFKLVSGLAGYRYVYTLDVRPSLSGCMLSTAAVIDLPAPLAALVVPIVIRMATRAATQEVTRLVRETTTRGRPAARAA